MVLPPRSADTMSDAIAIASPNGRMSKAAHTAAMDRLGKALFGPQGLQGPTPPPQPTPRERLLREAAQCRDLASRGMRPRAYIKQAEWCEAEAERAAP